MKKRYLRTSIEKALTLITMFMVMLTMMVNDFEVSWSTFFFAIVWFGTIALNVCILKRWGHGVWFEEN